MKKPSGAKPAPKGKPWAPVPVAVQRRRHRIAVRTWKPVPVSVQRKRHRLAVTKASKPKGKVRKLSPDGVACCAAQAVGTLLGLTDEEILGLYFDTASGPDDGATIENTVLAASALPLSYQHAKSGQGLEPCDLSPPRMLPAGRFACGLILGLELPEGPHAVLATPGGWWSWGELYDPDGFPGAVIEEAWAVTWRP